MRSLLGSKTFVAIAYLVSWWKKKERDTYLCLRVLRLRLPLLLCLEKAEEVLSHLACGVGEGAPFPSADLQQHFAEQPLERGLPDFSASLLKFT